jgi:hypothetical protein
MIALLDEEQRHTNEAEFHAYNDKIRDRRSANKIDNAKWLRLMAKIGGWAAVNQQLPLIADIVAEVTAPGVHTP